MSSPASTDWRETPFRLDACPDLGPLRQALDDAFRVHFLERTPDSGPWPCPYSGAQNVKVQVPGEPPKVAPSKPKPGVRVAEARLQTHELQDLADALGDLGKATAGHDLRLSVRIELSGDPPEEVVEKANEVLGEIQPGWKLK